MAEPSDSSRNRDSSPSPEQQITIDFFKELSLAKAVGFILAVSIGAFLFLIWLIYFRETGGEMADWVNQLPALNALLNSISAVLIVLGYRAIRQKQYIRHMKRMLSAFVTSSLFLISYLIYHNYAGHTPFPGEGAVRPIYFTILISHIVLSAFVLPMVLGSFYLAWSGRIATHRKFSKWTLPIWLYVSVTGVVIFGMLKVYG